jgi:hypothetical protein
VIEIRIYRAAADGSETAGSVNVWRYNAGAGPMVDGQRLDFSPASVAWQACSRINSQPADSVGVAVGYRYGFQTPFMAFSGMSALTMWDRTVMALNPTGD